MSEPRFTINPNARGIVLSMLKPAAEASARIVVDAVKDVMEEAPPRTGREYKIPGTETYYTASAPGEVPAIREGHYVASWFATKGYDTPRGVGAAAVSNLATDNGDPIGLLLEDGTSKMRPRPHLREAMNLAVPKIEAILADLRAVS